MVITTTISTLLVIVVELSAMRHSYNLCVGGQGAAVQGATSHRYRLASSI